VWASRASSGLISLERATHLLYDGMGDLVDGGEEQGFDRLLLFRCELAQAFAPAGELLRRNVLKALAHGDGSVIKLKFAQRASPFAYLLQKMARAGRRLLKSKRRSFKNFDAQVQALRRLDDVGICVAYSSWGRLLFDARAALICHTGGWHTVRFRLILPHVDGRSNGHQQTC
jgi:hypothetical protein